jgi:hypothetical protein
MDVRKWIERSPRHTRRDVKALAYLFLLAFHAADASLERVFASGATSVRTWCACTGG